MLPLNSNKFNLFIHVRGNYGIQVMVVPSRIVNNTRVEHQTDKMKMSQKQSRKNMYFIIKARIAE